MFRKNSNRNCVTLNQLITDISEWENYLSPKDKISNIETWVASRIPLINSIVDREINGTCISISTENKNKIMKCYFGHTFDSRSRVSKIDNEIERQLEQWPQKTNKTDKYISLLADKFELWMKSHNQLKNINDEQKILEWLRADLAFRFLSNHDQYLYLSSALKERGYSINLPADENQWMDSFNAYVNAYKIYIKYQKSIVEKRQSGMSILFANAVQVCSSLDLDQTGENSWDFYKTYTTKQGK